MLCRLYFITVCTVSPCSGIKEEIFFKSKKTVFYPFFWKSTKLTEGFITLRFFKHISGFCCITNILTLLYNQRDTRSHVACTAHIWFNYVSISGNIINILSISIERTVTVLFPLKAKLWITTFRTKKVFLITWYSVNFRIQILLVFENHKNAVLIQAHIKGVELLPNWMELDTWCNGFEWNKHRCMYVHWRIYCSRCSHWKCRSLYTNAIIEEKGWDSS